MPPRAPRLSRHIVSFDIACTLLARCAADPAAPLRRRPALAGSVEQLDRSRPGTTPIPADQPLSVAEVGLLAVRNSADLKALRIQVGVAQARVIQARLLPDPVLSGSYCSG